MKALCQAPTAAVAQNQENWVLSRKIQGKFRALLMSQIWFTTPVIEKSLGHSLAHEPNLVHSPGDRKKLVRSLAREPNLVCNPGDRKKIWFTTQVIEKKFGSQNGS